MLEICLITNNTLQYHPVVEEDVEIIPEGRRGRERLRRRAREFTNTLTLRGTRYKVTNPNTLGLRLVSTSKSCTITDHTLSSTS